MQLHIQPSSHGLTERPSIPETSMLEPKSRGVLDPPLSRRMTTFSDAPYTLNRLGAFARGIIPRLGAAAVRHHAFGNEDAIGLRAQRLAGHRGQIGLDA